MDVVSPSHRRNFDDAELRLHGSISAARTSDITHTKSTVQTAPSAPVIHICEKRTRKLSPKMFLLEWVFRIPIGEGIATFVKLHQRHGPIGR